MGLDRVRWVVCTFEVMSAVVFGLGPLGGDCWVWVVSVKFGCCPFGVGGIRWVSVVFVGFTYWRWLVSVVFSTFSVEFRWCPLGLGGVCNVLASVRCVRVRCLVWLALGWCSVGLVRVRRGW